jgi:UDP-N-acetylmuramoyl-tripeptide--D-alanyl-D-alanine ligase
MILTLAEIASMSGSASRVPAIPIAHWSIDTRTLPAGAAYFALKGETHDGHSFLDDAARRGAFAAIVEERGWPEVPGMHMIRVHDPLRALQSIAGQARRRLTFRIVAVTGSAGKTSTKDTIAALLGARLRVTKNEGNLNNHIGVPLSLLRLDADAQAGVLEMGMNHAGEIRFLAEMARPEVGVVTNVGTAHIENFDGIEGIALAKRELIECLPPDGVAVLNHDDVRVREFRHVHRGRSVTYGIEPGADVQAEEVVFSAEGASFRVQGTRFEIALAGKHGVWNVSAAVAVGMEFGVGLAEMAEAAALLRPGKMRGEREEFEGITILNDCYNSNPEAAKAMLETLAAIPGHRKIAVLGEMRELGAFTEQLHREVGREAARAGVDAVIGIRGAAAHLVDEARMAGIRGEALFYENPAEAGAAARALAKPGDVVLFKGSRGTRVELALERFRTN